MPTQSVWPSPANVVWWTASYVSVPERDTMPGCRHGDTQQQTQSQLLLSLQHYEDIKTENRNEDHGSHPQEDKATMAATYTLNER